MIGFRLVVVLLGLACIGHVQAQSRYADEYRQAYGDPDDGTRGFRSDGDRRGSENEDYARVVRVDPIIVAPPARQQCYDRDADQGYTQGGGDAIGDGPRPATSGGRIGATILGGVLGAVVGSSFGGGTGQVIGTAVGTAAGTAMGQSVYDDSHSTRGTVRVCEPGLCQPQGAGDVDQHHLGRGEGQPFRWSVEASEHQDHGAAEGTRREVKMSDCFWMVLADNSEYTRVRHRSFEEAKREAKRLAAGNPGIQFHVLRLVGTAIKPDPVEFVEAEDDPVPF